MSQVRNITSIVAAKGIVTEQDAIAEFWRRMAAANGGRPGKPEEYARIVSITQEQRGFVIRYEALAVLGKLITISPFSKVPVDHGQDGPRCASCLGDLVWNENGVGQFEKIPLVKVVPLGCPECSIGGFIWQCPVCKTVVADWRPIEQPTKSPGPVNEYTGDDRDPPGGGTD